MISLDLPTILISFILTNLLCAVVLFFLWQENRSRYSGLDLWMIGYICNVVGIALLAGRNFIPPIFSILLGSMLMVGGIFFVYIGIERFLINRKTPAHLYFILAGYFFLQIYFIYIFPSLEIRNVLFSVILVFFSCQCAWLIFWKIDDQKRILTRRLGLITSLFGLMAIIRIVNNVLNPPGNDLLRSTGYEALSYMVFQTLYILLTIALFMVVNRRLKNDLENDIAARKSIEKELQISQEKYAKAFQSSPTAILITRISDGRIIELNDGFLKTTGFSREEALEKTTIELGIWANPDDRARMVREMQSNPRLKDFHFDFRTKSRKIIKGEISAELIYLNGEECMLSVIQDITERYQIEEIMRIRLRLWDFSLSHNATEVMEEALNEIEILTDSQIGFYHLVDEDENTLSLQAWSTRTRKEFCRAEGSGAHYSIDKAGVWVDCIKTRKPVIFNNYASLPNKKGLPEGHTMVNRMLSVPIFSNNKIVSILGIGNKTTEYIEKDVELVEFIADLVWTIVSKMRMDEKVLQLNERLELLAMTDELTGLPNRRFFFERGAEEIRRSMRYKTPLALIMLDLDKFKVINDTYGHDTGDQALKCLANLLKGLIREVDLPARLGGEEFGILLPNTRLEDAVFLADRIRTAIEKLKCLRQDADIQITASLGVAEYHKNMKNLDALFHNADTALYEAKHSGRNRVALYQ
ncbi:MAG: diguanylate cyclase [Leptolinea sp.]|jgi:diguanylate cyclase (GGDEF)-like protein/PAS domain S-box-containing protein|nr:diguanylate cyclase [Leptolinea sp.]